MSDINIDDFFKDSAKSLVLLYSVFPRRQTLFVDDIYQSEEPDEFGMHSDRFRACFGALTWLGETNYLHFQDTIKDEAIDQAVLTGRSFTLLSSPASSTTVPETDQQNDLPALLQIEQATHIFRIKSALQQRSSTQLRLAMVALMAEMESLG
jgi:hypothetical protein